MTASLIVSALCLLLVGMFVGVRAVRAARERHWLGGTIRGLVAMLPLALAALAATLTVGLHGYRALSFEEVAATGRPEPVAPQRFRGLRRGHAGGDIRGTRLHDRSAGAGGTVNTRTFVFPHRGVGPVRRRAEARTL